MKIFEAKALTDTVHAAQGVELSHLATKTDLLELENRLVKWGIALTIGQVAVIAALVLL